MTKAVSFITYHYIRDHLNSRFPTIKALDISGFKDQLKYISINYNIISMEDVIDAFSGIDCIPERAALLTFDDGYIDHFINVFPILDEMGIQGSFFPSAKSIQEGGILDVNKIQLILAVNKDLNYLMNEILQCIERYRDMFQLHSNDYYLKKYQLPNRYNNSETMFVKNLLQYGLPEELRTIIINVLFKRYIDISEFAINRELYMTLDQLRYMKRHGMHIGSHGYTHRLMGKLSCKEQSKEIDLSLDFLKSIGLRPISWTISYPHGSYNQYTLELIEEKKCGLGLTIEPVVADINLHSRFKVPRFDANDFKIK